MWSTLTPKVVSTSEADRGRVVDFSSNPSGADPFADLHEIQGGEHSNPIVRSIAERAADAQAEALSGTVILDRQALDGSDAPNLFRAFQWAVDTVGQDQLGLMLTRDGRTLAQIEHGGPRGLQGFMPVGGLLDEHYERLQGRDRAFARFFEAQCKVLPSIIGCPEGGMIVELGAGLDLRRIQALQNLATSVGAQLICHDVVPDAPRRAHELGVTAPYLAIPPFTQFLGETLRGIEVPVVFSMKNVLSSLTCERLVDLFVTAELAGARRFSITQSVACSKFMVALPPGYGVEQGPLNRGLQSAWRESKAPCDEPLMRAAKFHAQITYTNATMELLSRYAEELALKRFGYRDFARVIETRETVLGEAEAMEYMAQLFPEQASDFSHGRYNTFVVSPFGGFFDLDPAIPVRNLRLTMRVFHLIADKERSAFPQQSERLVRVPPHQALTPRDAMRIPSCAFEADMPTRAMSDMQRAGNLGAAVALGILLDDPVVKAAPLCSVTDDHGVRSHLIDVFHRVCGNPAPFPPLT